jgi:U6 snRNA-associated Sm-like protein LSm7
MDFSGLIDKKIIVHFSGGREIIGTLKGYDQVSNMVMDEVFEIFTGII